MLRRVVLVCVCYSVLASAALASEPRDVNFDEVYGTWKGTWIPTLKFTGDRDPVGAPPYAPAAVEFVFREFTPTSDAGSVAVDGALGGSIVGLASSGPNLFATVFYDAEGEPNGYGDLTVTLSGNRFVGRFDERAPTSITHWEGPILLMKTDVAPAAPLVGRWKGEVEQVDPQVEFSVDMTINSLTVGAIAGAIEYPSLRCGGTLTLLSGSGNEFRFRERIRETGICVDDGLLVLTVTGDALDFRWSYPESESVDAAGMLDRSEFDALTDCPCIPPPGTVSTEQTSADVAGFVQNLLEASDAAPRCGEIRSSFYENYQPDKVELEKSLFEQERHCALNTAGILRDAAIHTVGIDGELVDLPVAEGELPVATLFDAFTSFYREVRGLRDLTSGVQNVAPRSAAHQVNVTTHLERSFADPAAALRDIKELLVEATVVLNLDERDFIAEGDYFADAFQTRSGRASAILTVTRVSDDGDEVEVLLHAFVNGTTCAGDCDSLGEVTVNEIITLVNIALGTDHVSGCTPGDSDHNSNITVDEILSAVNAALTGCSVLAG